MSNDRRKVAAATVSVISNTVLVAAKLVIGLAIGSVAVISEAIHSAVDLLAAAIALVAVRSANKPSDREHPYGHGKYENIAGTVEAILIFVAAGWIISEAIGKLRHPEPMEGVHWGVVVMALSAAVNWGVSALLFRVGKATDSVALQADAWHLRTDVWTSLGVMVGLGLVALGSWLWPGRNLAWLDPVSALVVALLILHAAWKLTVQAGRDLIDARLPDEEEAWVRATALACCPQACDLHGLRTRKSGGQRFVEMHLVVPGAMSVDDSHALTEQIERAVRSRFSACHLTIHVEPASRAGSDRSRPGL